MLFGQDPMHDFSEGVIGWFVEIVRSKYASTMGEAANLNRKLEQLKQGLSQTLRWPFMNDQELLAGAAWHLNGIPMHDR